LEIDLGGIYSNQLQGYVVYLKSDYTQYYAVTANTATVGGKVVLTVDKPLPAANGEWAVDLKALHEDIPSDTLSELISQAVARIKAGLPPKYFRMLSFVEGEMMFPNGAVGTETSYITKLGKVIAGSVVIWVNPSAGYADRHLFEDAERSGFTLENQLDNHTKVVFDDTMKPSEGDFYYIDYEHDLSVVPPLLKRMAYYEAAADVLVSISHRAGSADMSRADSWRAEVERRLGLLQQGQGIPEFDFPMWSKSERSIEAGRKTYSFGRVRRA
jgi:hypothetical protein